MILMMYLYFSCISFDSYTKPQRASDIPISDAVVYLLIPTPNHNANGNVIRSRPLYIFWFLHQTTTHKVANEFYRSCISFDSYTKPQRVVSLESGGSRCISFDSYTKPQPLLIAFISLTVVYLLIPTPNHNQVVAKLLKCTVVYLLIPTPNHNQGLHLFARYALYIFWFLHQTTTRLLTYLHSYCCISFDSYTKPQPCLCKCWMRMRCISFDSYTKPQPSLYSALTKFSCISFDSYTKPQPMWCARYYH